MNHLVPLNRIKNQNVGVWILLLTTVLLIPPTNAASQLSMAFVNPLQTPMILPKSHLLNPQVSLLQESTVIKPPNPANHLKSRYMEGVKMNLTHKGEAFDGYNVFILWEQNYTSLIKYCSLIVTNMKGEIIRETESISFPQNSWGLPSFHVSSSTVKFINSTTFLYGTDEGAVLWNIYDNTTVKLGFEGHHEYEYNPLNNTVFTFNAYPVIIDGVKYRFDTIVEYNTTGHLIWSLDTQSFIFHTQRCPYQDIWINADITHSNSLFFDPEEDVFYYHPRNLNTFYKIDHKTGQVLWGLGEYGNFTLFDQRGNQRQNLFYHAHAIEKVDDNTFILFDNDYHNQTNPNNKRSRILEIKINEATMTANESWAWIAPPDYYSQSLGDADRLPNGNRLGTFGTWGTWWHPKSSNIGARLVEVNEAGQIVWELNFSNTVNSLYGVYRLERFRLTPILSSPPDIRALSQDNVTVRWQTWYNFRTTRQMRGAYTLYLDGIPIENGSHVFNKFWRPTNLTVTLGKLEPGDYNLTVALADEAGHLTIDSLNISIKTFYLECDGSITIEFGQEDSLLQWKGETVRPLLATIARNNTQIASFMWNGSIITLDLNTFEVGTYFVTLQLFDNTELIHEDRLLVTIYPAAAPIIYSVPTDQVLTWNESIILSWEIFDHAPASWSILINETHTASGPWETYGYQLTWSPPVLDEGRYNVTFVAYDRIGYQIAKTTWLAVVPPSPPVIVTGPQQTEFQWGQEHASLSWEVHGGAYWTLWKNGTAVYNGEVTSPRIEVRIEDWQREDWRLGTYNLTLQVNEEGGAAATHTSWIRVWVNLGDAYADSVITGLSMWYFAGENALGQPDGKFARLYAGYGNGHVTLDMGSGEEILDGSGIDFTVYARGEYAVFVGTNLSASMLVGNQMSAPLILLAEGFGNTSFDLASTGLTQARYIQIVYLAGVDVELDAVVAVYFNQPPVPAPNAERWRFLIAGAILSLSTMVVIWGRRRRH